MIEEKLKQGLTVFKYRKSNGQTRVAYGTTNPNLIPKYNETKVFKLIEAAKEVVNSSDEGIIEENEIESLKTALKSFESKEKKKQSDEYVNYYDFEKKTFRKFRKDRLM